MGKVAVFRSVGRAYDFGFGHFGTALAICWLPFVLIGVAAYFLLVPAIGSIMHNFVSLVPSDLTTLSDTQKSDAARQFMMQFASVYRQIILFGLVCLFLRAMVAVGLTRASAGLEDGDGFFYFSLGATVWTLFGAWIATYLIMYAVQFIVVIIAVIAGLVICLPLVKVNILASIGVAVLLCFAVVCAIVYIRVRLTFFLPPVIVSEKKLDILRSWTLSEGNFWRIVGIYIGICVPLIVIAMMIDTAVLAALWPHLASAFAGMHAEQTVQWAQLAEQAGQMLPWLPPLLAAAFLAHVLFAAMLYSATARAYRGLVATDIASQTERE